MALPIPKYAGFAAGEDTDWQSLPGTVRVDESGVVFEDETGELRFPLSRVQFELAADRKIWISDAEQPSWQFGTSDAAILRDPGFKRDHRVRQQLRDIESRLEGGRTLRYALGFLTAFGFLAVLLWALGGVVVGVLVRLTPVAWEVEIGEETYQEMLPRLELLDDAQDKALLKGLGDLIMASLPDRRHPIQLVSVLDPIPNAFALPGGRIIVTSGMLDLVDDPGQLAGVLAHEMAHVTHRHSLRQVISTLGPYYVLRLFISDRQGFMTAVSAGSLLLVQQEFSREFERDADRTAWRHLVRANIDPRGLASLLRKISPMTERWQMGGALGRALRSHPPTPERIDSLDAMWAAADRKDGFRDLRTVVPP